MFSGLQIIMSKRNENRLGYKKTKVGWIPEEWDIVKMGSQIKLISGQHINAIDYNFEGIGLPYLTGPANYQNGKIQASKFVQVPKVVCKNGDILITCKGSGTGILVIADNAYCISRQIMAIRPKNLNIYFTFSFLKKHQEHFKQKATGLIPGISRSDILSFFISTPPLLEQKKIAEIFSTWDQAIEQVIKLIDAKQKIKKGLMQQLLTGKRRFKELNHETHEKKKGELPKGWKEKKLKNIADIFFSGVDKKSRDGQQKVYLCNYMDVYNNDYITKDINFMQATASDAEIEKFTLKIGDVIITKDSETPDDIGVPAVVKDRLENVVCGYHLALIRKNSEMVDSVFLAKQIAHERVANQLSRLANGATRFGLTTSSINNIKIWLADIKQQRRIAAVLSTSDKEIELLKKKMEKLKEQKKGLMQKLLTGEIRVKV